MVFIDESGIEDRIAHLPLKIEPIGCPETSVINYHPTLLKILRERRTHLHRGRILIWQLIIIQCLGLQEWRNVH